MRTLAVRSRQDEQMDAADLDPDVYAEVLHDLARVNRWTFTARPVLTYLKHAVGDAKGFRLMDVGFGDGDILRADRPLGAAARHRGGPDRGRSQREERRRGPGGDRRRPFRSTIAPATISTRPGPFDFVISSQVTHHMTDEQLTAFLRYMESEARRGWLICDLHRHGFAHWGFPLLARLLFVHRIVREDGQLSIARSFRPAEWRELLAEAGIAEGAARIVRRFPFRLCVERARAP